MRKTLAQIWEYALDLIFPIHCLGCGENREELPAVERWICPDCRGKVFLRSEQVCPHCERESEGGETHAACRSGTHLDGLWAATPYEGVTEKAVHSLKFGFLRGVAYPLAELMVRSVSEPDEFGGLQDLVLGGRGKTEQPELYADRRRNEPARAVLLPVPLHRRRQAWRGFNQSALLARLVGGSFGLPVEEDLIRRHRNTKPQTLTRNEMERRENIRDAFYCPQPEEVRGKDIILVDDICTTSATLDECARELKRCGARQVWALVMARR